MLSDSLVVTGYGLCTSGSMCDPKGSESEDSLLVKVALHSIRAALLNAGWDAFPLPPDLNAGIACLSPSGDGQTERWAYQAHNGQLRANPKRFGGLVHNSAAGRAAIEFGLIGPQIVIVCGDLLQMAKLQLLCGRTALMIACAANEVRHLAMDQSSKLEPASLESKTIAFSIIVERSDYRIKHLVRPREGLNFQLLEKEINNEGTQNNIDVFWKQWVLAKDYLDKYK